MAFERLAEIDRKLHADYDELLGDHESVFSSNTKLGWSIDFSIARTCLGRTPICSAVCYGTRRGAVQAANLDVLEKHLRVLRYFQEADAEVAAWRVVTEYETKRMSCLRWCGVGDLTIEVVRVINVIAREYPHVRQWVVSRIPHLLAQVDRRAKNIALMFSADQSLESALAVAEMARCQHPLVRYSFLRTDPEDPIPDGMNVVFDVRKGMPSPPSAFTCPADAGRFPLKSDACERCGWRCARPLGE